jgi:hypothetical protein
VPPGVGEVHVGDHNKATAPGDFGFALATGGDTTPPPPSATPVRPSRPARPAAPQRQSATARPTSAHGAGEAADTPRVGTTKPGGRPTYPSHASGTGQPRHAVRRSGYSRLRPLSSQFLLLSHLASERSSTGLPSAAKQAPWGANPFDGRSSTTSLRSARRRGFRVPRKTPVYGRPRRDTGVR